MLNKLTFNEDYVCFFKGQSFELRPVTLLVGDQGSGKSTFIGAIKEWLASDGETKAISIGGDLEIGTSYRAFDTESDNPRIGSGDPFSSSGMLYTISSKYQSHGEVIVPILSDVINAEKTLVLIDEPETSLSLRSQYKFCENLRRAVDRGCQIILATHSLVLMEEFQNSILSMETRKYLTLDQFKKSQRRKSNFKERRDDRIIKKTHCKMGNACECANSTGWYNNKCEHYVNSRAY